MTSFRGPLEVVSTDARRARTATRRLSAVLVVAACAGCAEMPSTGDSSVVDDASARQDTGNDEPFDAGADPDVFVDQDSDTTSDADTNGDTGSLADSGTGRDSGTVRDGGSDAPLIFAIVGDYGNNSTAERDVAALIGRWTPSFIITAGDNNYTLGAASTIDANIGKYYHAYIGNYSGTYGAGSPTNRFFPALGNHDWMTAGAAAYLRYFTLPGNERYYDFVHGPVHFFSIDSDTNEPSGTSATSTQANWLRGRLAASTAKWKIVYFHHPPYSSGEHQSSTYMRWPFKAWGASIVISGHEHSYERVSIGGYPYIVNGNGGQPMRPFGTLVSGSVYRNARNFGAQRVTATATSIKFDFIGTDNTVLDTITLH